MAENVVGRLIQMNAHMVVPRMATLCMVMGFLGFVGFMAIAAMAIRAGERSWAVFCVVLALVGVVLFVDGVTTPRVKEIRACADGPVSLEQIGSVYDIVDVDGKELTLRTR